ncbi:MAG: hypothetical protein GYA34_17470 [Chloroflexi bacterium]|nr:hypothetical protein [Chloroflexota bacterium]
MDYKIRDGIEVEDMVENICTKMFFSDFVVRNPMYMKIDGTQKEAADLLVPFKNHLLVFQVKSKIEYKKASEKSEIDFGRIAKVTNSAIKQLKTIKRAIENNWLKELTTVKGYKISFVPKDYTQIIGIVVVDLIGEEKFSWDERTGFVGNYLFRHNMPIHIFTRDEFEALSTELDTLPDLVTFLDIRQLFIERRLFLLPVPILDFLVFYKTKPDEVDRILENRTNLILEEGMWETYLDKFASVIRRRNELNKPRYLIDAIIDYLHTSVGYTDFDHVAKELGITGQGSIEGYLTSARELASLSRLERRILGERLLRCMKNAETQEQSYSLVMNENDASAFLVLSMSGDRSKRQSTLYLLCAMAYCYLNLNQIIGISTESLNVSFRSYDVFGLKETKILNHDELAEQAKSFFSKPYTPEVTEYQGRIDQID